MAAKLDRRSVFPEASLPEVAVLVAEGQSKAKTVPLGASPFLKTYGVASEADYKRARAAEGRVMIHAQIGFREPAKSQRAWFEVWNALEKGGYRLDRYGICLDWSMGYPEAKRKDMPKGTGLVINGVYGGPARDYGFIAATVMLLGWVTVFYPSWAAGRERHRRECTAAYLAHRRALAERISGPLAARLAELHPVVGRLAELQQLPLGEPRATDSGPPAAARDLLGKLAQEHERLTSRLSYLPPTPGPETPGILRSVDAEATSLEEQLVLHLARLKTDLLARTGAPEAAARLEGARSGHCAACGQAAPGGRYCAQCGTLRPRETTCEGCSARLLLPLHLIPAERREGPMHCPDCGGRLQWRSYQDAERGPKIVGDG